MTAVLDKGLLLKLVQFVFNFIGNPFSLRSMHLSSSECASGNYNTVSPST